MCVQVGRVAQTSKEWVGRLQSDGGAAGVEGFSFVCRVLMLSATRSREFCVSRWLEVGRMYTCYWKSIGKHFFNVDGKIMEGYLG